MGCGWMRARHAPCSGAARGALRLCPPCGTFPRHMSIIAVYDMHTALLCGTFVAIVRTVWLAAVFLKARAVGCTAVFPLHRTPIGARMEQYQCIEDALLTSFSPYLALPRSTSSSPIRPLATCPVSLLQLSLPWEARCDARRGRGCTPNSAATSVARGAGARTCCATCWRLHHK
jgi:hypothetical protein